MKITTNHRSIRLTKEEKSLLKKKVAEQPSQEAAAIAIGLGSRPTLTRILSVGSGTQKNIELVRKYIAA